MAIGAAPDVAWTSRPPKMLRTLTNSSASALSNAACSASGTSWPASRMRRTVRPSFVAPAIFSGSLLEVTSV